MQLIVITGVLLCLTLTAASPVVCATTTTTTATTTPVVCPTATTTTTTTTVPANTVCPNMKTAAKFAVIAGAGMTNTGLSIINGQVALSPTPALTGFPPGVISGLVDYNNAAAIQAETDCTSAYTYCQGLPSTSSLTGIDLAGKILTPGIYKFASTAGISAGGTLTFNGPGVYIFQVGSAITTGASSRIVLENGALAGCVYWQLGSSATFGASSSFLGNVLAYASTTFGNAVTYNGTVCAHTGDVTLINDNINQQTGCTC